jgi:hypothetical protein
MPTFRPSRRHILLGLALVAATLVCFAGWRIAHAPKVTRKQLEQVEGGMSREEIVRMVGQPVPMEGLGRSEYWACDEIEVGLLVRFDNDGRAAAVRIVRGWGPPPPPPSPLVERIRSWLGLDQ